MFAYVDDSGIITTIASTDNSETFEPSKANGWKIVKGGVYKFKVANEKVTTKSVGSATPDTHD